MAVTSKPRPSVGLSRDVGLARQDTSVAFVRQSYPVHISSSFLSHIYLYMYLLFFLSLVCAVWRSTCSCRLNGARSKSSLRR